MKTGNEILWCPGDKVTWVQCDICELWFHFHCIGVDSISEHEDYMCSRCTEKRYTSLMVTAAQHKTPTADPSEFGTESASSETSSGEEDEDEHMKEFYAESVDSYIIRSRRQPSTVSSVSREPACSSSDSVIVLE